MRTKVLWIRDEYLCQILDLSKTVEVRVAYSNVARLQVGDRLLLNERHPYRIRRVARYADFDELLAHEETAAIAPGLSPGELLIALRSLYPAEKEALGAVAIEIRPEQLQMATQTIEQAPYYQYRELEAEIYGRTVRYFDRPALGRWQDRLTPAALLAEGANVKPEAQVLHMHCGDGLVGAAVASRLTAGRVTMLDCHVAAVETAQRTLRTNGVRNAAVSLSDCAQAVRERTFDSVLALLPKSRAVWEQTVLDAHTVLCRDGDLYLAGANRGGIKSAGQFMERVFGNVQVLAYRGGCRVLYAVKSGAAVAPESTYHDWQIVDAEVDGTTLAFASKPGIFSWDRLDAGTRLLVEALGEHPLRSDDQVLDVGCGSGVLTLVAARQAYAGHVVGVDADCRAVEATQRTLAHHQVTNGEALLSDCSWAVRDRSFTAVVTNPPFHKEQATTYATAEQIVRDAACLLRKRGRLYLVANAFLKYGPVIEEAFGNAQLLRQTNRFSVWYASQRR